MQWYQHSFSTLVLFQFENMCKYFEMTRRGHFVAPPCWCAVWLFFSAGFFSSTSPVNMRHISKLPFPATLWIGVTLFTPNSATLSDMHYYFIGYLLLRRGKKEQLLSEDWSSFHLGFWICVFNVLLDIRRHLSCSLPTATKWSTVDPSTQYCVWTGWNRDEWSWPVVLSERMQVHDNSLM